VIPRPADCLTPCHRATDDGRGLAPRVGGGHPPPSDRFAPSRLLLVFLVALFLRAAYGSLQMWRTGDATALTFPDEQQYWLMARSLWQGEPLTDELGFHATRMPLYPALLSLFAGSDAGVIGARVCQWLIGAAAAVFAALLGARIAGSAVGLVAGLLVALDPSCVGLSSLLLTETPYVAAIAALWWVGWPLQRRGEPGATGRWIAVGALCSLIVYVRPSAVGLVAVWSLFLLVRRGFDRRGWVGGAIVAAMVVASLVPWAARNHRVTGHWCWLTHRAGISLYDGVGPQATGASDLGRIKNMPAVAGLDELAWNQYFLDESFRAIRQDPLRIIRLAGIKLARTWSPVLHAEELRSRSIRLIFAAWSVPFLALAIAGLVILRKQPGTWIGLLLPALYLSALHSVFVGSVRYRAGAVPTLAVLAALAAVTLWRRLTSPMPEASR